ncbi:hypothetical protein DFJ58DRAFT_844068 [Suillus subalutaceus]|uniref:uncharacterized protein n=1 Tax=Suillus subalutaceus TaxID=48586 RepID=UPI001B8853B3|nr:uncharacterized protein DFJ58DRAFT_844068 [Suillus subalutaceus]KAG1844160.1 hypothetical protein DFJ58DRAFT_844068 [Suillus subalutaceus]
MANFGLSALVSPVLTAVLVAYQLMHADSHPTHSIIALATPPASSRTSKRERSDLPQLADAGKENIFGGAQNPADLTSPGYLPPTFLRITSWGASFIVEALHRFHDADTQKDRGIGLQQVTSSQVGSSYVLCRELILIPRKPAHVNPKYLLTVNFAYNETDA